MHLSIGLHTSARKSYPQPLQPAKHRGIAPDINQRLYSDRLNYLLKARSGGRFFAPLRGKISTSRRWKMQPPIHQLLKFPKRQLISGVKSPPSPQQNNRLTHSTIDTTSTDQKKRPLLVSKRTSTTHPIVPVLLTRVTSTGQLADQYWSHLPLNRSEAASSNSRPSPTHIYTTRPRAGSCDHNAGRIP